MNKYLLLLLVVSLFSCGYRIPKNNDGEPIVDEKLYTFNKTLTAENLKIIDTSAIYVQIFEMKSSNEQERSNPKVYGFHNNGYFKINSVKYYGKFDDHRPKNSIYYGGKFYLQGNEIFLEAFHSVSVGNTNRYNKVISNGIIKNDTLSIITSNDTTFYVKRRLEDIIK